MERIGNFDVNDDNFNVCNYLNFLPFVALKLMSSHSGCAIYV